MKNKTILKLILLTAVLYSGYVFAQSSFDDISYPIPELGNCTSKTDCKEYCDNEKNMSACLIFAEQNNLMSSTELNKAKKITGTGLKGPGGCSGKEQCQLYCDDIDHINECIAFAEENDLLQPDELAEARKIKQAIDSGIKPPACKNKKECDSYCSKGENMEECIGFAEKAGFLQAGELQEAKKVLQAIKRGAKPPPCRGKVECDAYCAEDSHFQECMVFAEAAGLVSPEELEMMKKTGGKGPGGCRGKEACDTYCENNMEACTQFALDNGLIKPEEAEMMKKTGGKGPGGCKGKEGCESFCNDPANQETCFNFAKENGLISEEDLKKMEDGREQMKGAVSGMPAEVKDCLRAGVGEEVLSKLESGTFLPSREVGEKMGECFQQMGPPQDQRDGFEGRESGSNRTPPQGSEGQPGEFRSGPGGCTSPEECRSYCESNPQECGIPSGGQTQESSQGREGDVPPQDYQRPPGEFRPPEGQMPRGDYQQPPGEFRPPEGYQQQPPGEFQPPEEQMPRGDYQQPPEGYQQAPQNYQAPSVEQNNTPSSGETAPPPPPTTEPVSILFRSLRAMLLFLVEPMVK